VEHFGRSLIANKNIYVFLVSISKIVFSKPVASDHELKTFVLVSTCGLKKSKLIVDIPMCRHVTVNAFLLVSSHVGITGPPHDAFCGYDNYKLTY
jgi:hypothetical protein